MTTELEHRGIEDLQPSTKLNRVARRWKGPRQYSAEEMGTALAVLDHYSGNMLRTARELGIPRSTIQRWVDNPENLPPACVTVRQRKREEFAQLSDEASEWIVTSITPKDIRKAGLRDKVVAYGILRDKSAQDRGELPGQGATSEAAQIALKAIETLFRLAQERGQQVSKEEVASRYLERRPELRQAVEPLLLKGKE